MASFFCGCVVLPLQYLHQMSVAYRDLKPENLLLGQDGYLKVVFVSCFSVHPPSHFLRLELEIDKLSTKKIPKHGSMCRLFFVCPLLFLFDMFCVSLSNR